MEKRIEKWESLRLEAQEFTSQEYVAACDVTIVPYINGDIAIPSNAKFYKDTDDVELTFSPSSLNDVHQTYHYTTFSLNLEHAAHYYYFVGDTNGSKAASVFNSADPVSAWNALKSTKEAYYIIGDENNGGGHQVHAGTIDYRYEHNNS